MEKFIRMFINFKGVIRLISFIAVIMYFVPSYAVSCSGRYESISQLELTIGKSLYGGSTPPCIPFILALFIPIAIIALSFLWKKENEKLMSLLSLIGGGAGFLMLFIMRITIQIYIIAHKSDYGYYTVRAHTRFGAYFIGLLYIGIIVITLLSMLKVIDADKCFLSEETIKSVLGSMTMKPNPQATPVQSVPQPVQQAAPVQPVPQPVQQAAPVQSVPQPVQQAAPVQSVPQPVQQAAPVQPVPQPVQEAAPTATVDPGVKYCSKCGNKLTAEMQFCGKCGTKCE